MPNKLFEVLQSMFKHPVVFPLLMFIRVTNQLSAKVAQNVLIKIHEKINIELHAKGLHIKYYKNSNE